MSVKKWSVAFGIIVILSMVLSACAAPTPQVVEKVVTQIVTQKEEVKVVQTQVVEKAVEKVVEKMITATPPPAAAVRKVMRVNLSGYPDNLDPQQASFVNEIAHLSMIYEGLTKLDKDLKTIPGAAEKWEYNKDATELTFTLRKDSKYSDGTPLNAARFAYAIKRNIDPATAGEYAAITDEIKGAPEWRGFVDDPKKSKEENAAARAAAKKVVDASVQALTADGKPCAEKDTYKDAACTTLKLTFSKPAPYFHTVMSLWVTYPAKEENIASSEIWWTSSKYQIGNGPYTLKSIEPYVRGVFTPNPNYYGDKTKTDVEYSYITDSAVAFQAYKNNEFDVVGLAAEDYKVVMADANLSKEAKVWPGACTFAVMFHQLKEPFTDPKVRQAFAQAYDRTTWVKDVLAGLGAPTLTWIPPGYPGYDKDEKRWGFDPAAAKKALSESKYGSADKLPPIKLTFSDSPRNRTRYEWLAAQWKQHLGVNVTLDPVESDDLHCADQGCQDRAVGLHPGLVRRLPRSAELDECLLEDGRVRRAHRLLQQGLGRDDGQGRCGDQSRSPHEAVCGRAEEAVGRRACGYGLEQREYLHGEAVGEGLPNHPAGSWLPWQLHAVDH